MTDSDLQIAVVREYPLEVGVVSLQQCLEHVREEEECLAMAFDEERQERTDGKSKPRKKLHSFTRLELVTLLK
jgi:hypothetical protein